MLHDRAEGTELLLILTDLAAVGRVGLLDAVQQLADLLALAVELDIEAVVVGRELGILTLQLDKFVGKVLLVDSQVVDHLLPVYPHVRKYTGQHHSHCGQYYNGDFKSFVGIVRLVVLRGPLGCGSAVCRSFVLFHFYLSAFNVGQK